MTSWYVFAAGASFLLAVILTPLVRRLAWRFRVIDDPAIAPERKRHTNPTAMWGGLAIILSTAIVWWILVAAGKLQSDIFPLKYIIGLTVAAAMLAIGGMWDDRRRLKPGQQFIWPVLAGLTIILSGIGVQLITNPFGGAIHLDRWLVNVGPIHVSLLAAGFAFIWILGMTYTTKILDGLDGLVTGFGVIGSLIVFLLTLRPEVDQPSVALLALSLTGATTGFLIFNWHPAKIFLGESGSLYIGFLLGVLSIISGGKIATALLIMGLPIIDLAWVILQRWVFRRRSPFQTGDRLHLHFRLLDAGLSVRQSVLLLYAVSILFGLSTLWFRGMHKVYALVGVVIVMALLALWTGRRTRQTLDHQSKT